MMFGRNQSGAPQQRIREQEIAAEARQRLASKGGKPSDMPGMVQQIIAERRMMDEQDRSTDRSPDGYQMPNNMEQYIDRVLQMSGMTQAPASSGQQLPQEGPVPQSRDDAMPIGEMEGPPMPEEGNADEDAIIKDGESKGWPVAKIAEALALAGGTYAAMRYLMRNTTALPEGNETRNPASVLAPPNNGLGPRVGNSVVDAADSVNGDAPRQIEGPEAQRRLPAPPTSAASIETGVPDPINETIDAIDTDAQRNRLTYSNPDTNAADSVEGRTPAVRADVPRPERGPSIDDGAADSIEGRAEAVRSNSRRPERNSTVSTMSEARIKTEALKLIQEGRTVQAFQLFRDNGIEIPDAAFDAVERDTTLGPKAKDALRKMRGVVRGAF
jgi:hypothetical protein